MLRDGYNRQPAPESHVTSSFSPSQPARRGPAPANAVIVGLVAGLAVVVLFVLGVTFFGLAIAFPIAVPIAEAYHLPVSAGDAALAEQFAGFWWAFAALALATFAAAGVIVVKLIDFLSPAPRD
jgi:hypothetical protein